jgi:hypothetical protein
VHACERRRTIGTAATPHRSRGATVIAPKVDVTITPSPNSVGGTHIMVRIGSKALQDTIPASTFEHVTNETAYAKVIGGSVELMVKWLMMAHAKNGGVR